jgi:alpha-beta hydrolase superfamily lysophospholipase
MTTTSEQLRELVAADGVRLRYRSWVPAGTVRGTVQVVHGASEHSGRYGRLAGALTARGLAVSALDLRGHGRTAEATGPGRFGAGGVDGLAADVLALQELAAAEHPGVPRVLVGHSMGSVVALAAAEQSGGGLAGLVLSGPIGVAPHLAESVAALEASTAAGAGDTPLDALGAFNQPFEPARTPYDWLSRDPAEVDAYLADPYCGDRMPLTTAYAAGVFGLSVRAASEEGVATLPDGLPVLLLAGRQDPVGGVDAAQVTALADLLRARGLPVDLRIYEDARHEVLNETNRDEVTGDLLAWVEARLSG